jgi:predicted ABC-type ATPase
VPRVVVIAGINGAGKTTASVDILTRAESVPTFVNADAIARGLNGINPEGVAIPAGKLMLEQLDKLAERREDFAFETTLAARTYARWLGRLRESGYQVHLYYYWLSSADLAVSRVAARVKSGGHHIPDHTVRQRYARSVGNFFELYRPICDYWEAYDNSGGERTLIALGSADEELYDDLGAWLQFQRSADHE